MTEMGQHGRFYVYVLSYPDGHPFYVGMGQGKRILVHESEARRGHACEKCEIIRAIWEAGGQVGREVVFRADDQEEAFRAEARVIERIGIDVLVNKTAGGMGLRGFAVSPETRAKIAQRAQARFADPQQREWMRSMTQEVSARPEVRAKRSSAALARWAQPEFRAKVYAKRQGHEVSEETRAKLSEKLKGLPQSAETRAKRSESMRAAWQRRKAEQGSSND